MIWKRDMKSHMPGQTEIILRNNINIVVSREETMVIYIKSALCALRSRWGGHTLTRNLFILFWFLPIAEEETP